MRERTYKVDKDKLAALSGIYRSSKIAQKLDISKQRWHHYKKGKNDMPESVVDRLCAAYGLDKNELVLSQ